MLQVLGGGLYMQLLKILHFPFLLWNMLYKSASTYMKFHSDDFYACAITENMYFIYVNLKHMLTPYDNTIDFLVYSGFAEHCAVMVSWGLFNRGLWEYL